MADAARTLFLVCYDVCDTRRRNRAHKLLLGYKIGGQKSLFECWFTSVELRNVLAELIDLIDPVEDKVHIFQLDPRMQIEGLGVATLPTSSAFMIV